VSYYERMRWLSPRTEVRFAGFRAYLDDLQRCGWEISLEERSYDTDELVFYFRHTKHDTRMISNPVSRYESLMRTDFLHGDNDQRKLFITIQYFTGANQTMRFMHSGSQDLLAAPIDARPQLVTHDDMREMELDNMVVFKPLEAEQEIIIPDEPTVAELLTKIKRMQLPQQQAIHQRNRVRALRNEGSLLTLVGS